MSSKRAADMADIQAAISLVQQKKEASDRVASQLATELGRAPSEREEREVQTQIEENLELERKQQSLIKERTQAAVRASQRVVDSTRNGLGTVRIPGGLLFPLLTLLILFMLLVQVDGHSRLGWLWLAFIGDAEVTGGVTQPIISQSGGVFGGGAGSTFGSGLGMNLGNAPIGGTVNQGGITPLFVPSAVSAFDLFGELAL